MIDTAVRLFQLHGYHATSWRGLVTASETPWGSVHHHFPGGKEELGVAAITTGGDMVASLGCATMGMSSLRRSSSSRREISSRLWLNT